MAYVEAEADEDGVDGDERESDADADAEAKPKRKRVRFAIANGDDVNRVRESGAIYVLSQKPSFYFLATARRFV